MKKFSKLLTWPSAHTAVFNIFSHQAQTALTSTAIPSVHRWKQTFCYVQSVSITLCPPKKKTQKKTQRLHDERHFHCFSIFGMQRLSGRSLLQRIKAWSSHTGLHRKTDESNSWVEMLFKKTKNKEHQELRWLIVRVATCTALVDLVDF